MALITLLNTRSPLADPATQRAAYVAYLCQRLAAREGFVQEAIRARA